MGEHNTDLWRDAWNATPQHLKTTGMGDASTGMGDEQLEFMEPDNQPMFYDEEEHGADELDNAAQEQAANWGLFDLCLPAQAQECGRAGRAYRP